MPTIATVCPARMSLRRKMFIAQPNGSSGKSRPAQRVRQLHHLRRVGDIIFGIGLAAEQRRRDRRAEARSRLRRPHRRCPSPHARARPARSGTASIRALPTASGSTRRRRSLRAARAPRRARARGTGTSPICNLPAPVSTAARIVCSLLTSYSAAVATSGASTYIGCAIRFCSSSNHAMVASSPCSSRPTGRQPSSSIGAADVRLAPARVVHRQAARRRRASRCRSSRRPGRPAACTVNSLGLPRLTGMPTARSLSISRAQPLDHVVDVAEAARLRAVAVDGDVLARQRLADDVGDDASVVAAHARTVSVEDARDAHVGAARAQEIERQRLRGALAFVVAGARAGAVDPAA